MKDAVRPITLAHVAREVGVNPCTVFRWGHDGLSKDGARIRLRMGKIGGRWMVYPADLAAFFDRLNAGHEAETARSPSSRTPSARRKAIERAEHELESIGI
jgi:hypothetical protein